MAACVCAEVHAFAGFVNHLRCLVFVCLGVFFFLFFYFPCAVQLGGCVCVFLCFASEQTLETTPTIWLPIEDKMAWKVLLRGLSRWKQEQTLTQWTMEGVQMPCVCITHIHTMYLQSTCSHLCILRFCIENSFCFSFLNCSKLKLTVWKCEGVFLCALARRRVCVCAWPWEANLWLGYISLLCSRTVSCCVILSLLITG